MSLHCQRASPWGHSKCSSAISDELDVAAGGRAEEKLLGDRAARRHDAFLQTSGSFIVEQPPQSIGQPEVAGCPCIHESAVTFEQLHHRPILPAYASYIAELAA